MIKRFEIQALRAVAVVCVLLFHSGFLLKAGYLGVDVFFVVSGFVVTQLIIRRIQIEGKLDLPKFWKKRIRRLFPALILMVTVLSPISLLVFPRLEEAEAGIVTGFAGIFSTANVATALLEFDYFAAPSKENFMLHLWSLSVEEQFYIFWPLAFVAFWHGHKLKRFRIWVALLSVISLAVWIVGSTELLGFVERGQTLFGFFSPVARAWEFLAGAMVALMPASRRGTRPSNLLSKLGWATMIAILVLAPSEQPGVGLAVVGLVLSVCSILRWGANGDIEQALQAKSYSWIQFIGDRSYSLYLWHWPLAVFGTILVPENALASLVGIIISVPLALLAFKLVEQPLRFGSGIGRHRLRIVAPGLLLTASLSLSGTAFLFGGVEQRVSAQALPGGLNESEIFAEMNRISVGCSFTFRCFQTKKQGDVDMLILGNSHGAHLTVGLARAFPSQNVVWVADSSLLGGGGIDISEILKEIPKPHTIIVSEYLSKPGAEDREIDWVSALTPLTESGADVVVTDGSPTLEVPAYKCKFGVLWDPSQHRCGFPSTANNERHTKYATKIMEAAKKLPNIQVADTYGLFCDSEVCVIGNEDGIFFRDLNHFTILGSEMAAEAIMKNLTN